MSKVFRSPGFMRSAAEMEIPSRTLPVCPQIKLDPFEIIVEPRVFPSSAGAVAEGAFYSLITDADGGIFLQGGTVNGVPVSTSDLKVFRSPIETPPDGEWVGDPDDHLYLEVTGNGTVADGVLLPGFTVTAVTVNVGAPSVHDPPTATSYTGKKCYLSLGVFFAGAFYPAMPGNYTVAVCVGGFVISPPV